MSTRLDGDVYCLAMVERKTLLGVLWDRQLAAPEDPGTLVRGEGPNPPASPPRQPEPLITRVRGEQVMSERQTEARGESPAPQSPPPETKVRGESPDSRSIDTRVRGETG